MIYDKHVKKKSECVFAIKNIRREKFSGVKKSTWPRDF